MTRTLTMGRPRERDPAPLWGWIQTKATREEGVSGTHSPLVPSTGTSEGHLQTWGDKAAREMGVGVRVGKMPIGQLRKRRERERREEKRILQYDSMILSLNESGKGIPLREMGKSRGKTPN